MCKLSIISQSHLFTQSCISFNDKRWYLVLWMSSQVHQMTDQRLAGLRGIRSIPIFLSLSPYKTHNPAVMLVHRSLKIFTYILLLGFCESLSQGKDGAPKTRCGYPGGVRRPYIPGRWSFSPFSPKGYVRDDCSLSTREPYGFGWQIDSLRSLSIVANYDLGTVLAQSYDVHHLVSFQHCWHGVMVA